MYYEMHARSAFSFLEAASLPERMVVACAEQELPGIAILDRDGVYGAPRLHTSAKRAGIRAHYGAEISVEEHGRIVRYPVLVESQAGYQNLCRLITQYKSREVEKGSGAATFDELAEHSNGLVLLTGDEQGPLAAALREGGGDAAQQCLDRLTQIFGSTNIFVELQRHFLREEEERNQAAIELARANNLPLLATNGVRYAHPEEREILDVFTCMHHHAALSTAGRLLSRNSERCLRTPKQMADVFSDLPEAMANTVELSSRLKFSLTDLGYEFPRYPVPDGESMHSFLRKRTHEGMRLRYLTSRNRHLFKRAQRQIGRELDLIEHLDLAGYFLIVWDIVRFCEREGILVQGRGSAANSAVCYALGITAVDPIGMDLLFERFLSEERGEWPDIDLDLPSGDQRERAIQYVYERYGKLGAAMTANVITYRGRSASREVGKALGFDLDSINRISMLVGSWEYKGPEDTFEAQFRRAGFDLKHARIAKYLELCLRMQDLPRHLGQHSGGMVICQGQLNSVVPLEPATMPGRTVIQWDKDDCADLGIVKVDLLGLGMMAVLEDCQKLVPQHYGVPLDIAQIPHDDADVYGTLQKADTVGMFQVESRAQMSCLPRNCPTKFYDLVVQVALIRPGPIVGKMVHPYLARRQGREEVVYPHPSLEPVLQRTLGVPLFQEQLLRMAMIVANFTGGEAEELRRALGSRRSQIKMRAVTEKLRRGMTANGINQEAQDKIEQSITSFALYGFPESHSASFALLAYASAYIKEHYLAAFLAALLNNQPMGFYSPATLVKDAQRHGLKVLPIDVTVSDWKCTLTQLPDDDSQAVRLGLRYVRGLRESSACSLLTARQQPFTSIDDFVKRVPDLRRDELVMLASVGALNNIGSDQEGPSALTRHKLRIHRRDALWQVEAAGRPAGPLLHDAVPDSQPSPLARMNTEERLVADFRGTGLTVGPHPMSYKRAELSRNGVLRAIDLTRVPNGKRVKICGLVIARQRPGTASGFIFLSLEDETGISNAIITPQLYEENRMTVIHGRYLLVDGTLQNLENVISVKAHSIRTVDISAGSAPSHNFH